MEPTGYRHNPDLSRASTIPARWYTDPAMLENERRQVFARTWQAAGHAAAVAQPGSYQACDVAGEPVLITRARDDELRALSNVCRHRGAVLTEGCGPISAIRPSRSFMLRRTTSPQTGFSISMVASASARSPALRGF